MVLSDITTTLSILLVAILLLIFMIKVIRTHGKSAHHPSQRHDDQAAQPACKAQSEDASHTPPVQKTDESDRHV